MRVEVGLMHLARGIAFRVEVVSDCQWGVLNFSIRACLLASMTLWGGGGWMREGMLCKLEPTNTVYEENMCTTIDFIKEKPFTKKI